MGTEFRDLRVFGIEGQTAREQCMIVCVLYVSAFEIMCRYRDFRLL